MQLEYFSRPKLQIRVIRILWMVPIYALDAWLALRFEVRLPPDVVVPITSIMPQDRFIVPCMAYNTSLNHYGKLTVMQTRRRV